jgi:uncharacterized protein YtpQ (UPF0354 family)
MGMTTTQLILAGLGLIVLVFALISFRKPKAPDAAAFTQDYIAQLKKIKPEAQANVVGELELEIIFPGSREPLRAFLDNAFRDYSQSPKDKNAILARYVGALAESRANAATPIDPARILPVIRDREFVEQAGRLPRNGDKGLDVASEQLNEELYVMYVADSEHSVRYLSEADLEAAKVDRANLRKQSMENLRRLYPEVQMMGTNGLYMIRLDGTYESSLLLSERLWDLPDLKVKGEFLVAVPSRDVLVISGTLEREPLETMRKIVAEVSATASYRISPKLFIRRDGNFEAWE